jgi:hypothetical protein
MAERRVFFNPMMSDAEIEFRIDNMIESGIAALADDLHARLTSTPIDSNAQTSLPSGLIRHVAGRGRGSYDSEQTVPKSGQTRETNSEISTDELLALVERRNSELQREIDLASFQLQNPSKKVSFSDTPIRSVSPRRSLPTVPPVGRTGKTGISERDLAVEAMEKRILMLEEKLAARDTKPTQMLSGRSLTGTSSSLFNYPTVGAEIEKPPSRNDKLVSQNVTSTTDLTAQSAKLAEPSVDAQNVSAASGKSVEIAKLNKYRPQIKVTPYDGSTSLHAWLEQFSIAAENNGWTAEQKASFLKCSLKGGPSQLLYDMGTQRATTFDEIVQILKDRYGTEQQCELYRSQLRTRRRGRNESLADLFMDIKRLMFLAYAGPQNAMTETIARDYFLDALADREFAIRIRQRDPDTLHSAYLTAVRLEAYDRTPDPSDEYARGRGAGRPVRAVASDTDTGAKASAANLAARLDQVLAGQTALQNQMSQLDKSAHQKFTAQNGNVERLSRQVEALTAAQSNLQQQFRRNDSAANPPNTAGVNGHSQNAFSPPQNAVDERAPYYNNRGNWRGRGNGTWRGRGNEQERSDGVNVVNETTKTGSSKRAYLRATIYSQRREILLDTGADPCIILNFIRHEGRKYKE